MLKIFIFYMIWQIHLYGTAFDSEYNHCSQKEIKNFKVCGERCSGTNFPSLSYKGDFDFAPDEEQVQRL